MMNRRLKKLFRVLENTVLKDKKYIDTVFAVFSGNNLFTYSKDTDFVRDRINRQSGSESNYAVFEIRTDIVPTVGYCLGCNIEASQNISSSCLSNIL